MRRSTEAAPDPLVALVSRDKPQEKKNSNLQLTGLVPLRDYHAPTMPAESVVRAVWRRIKERFDTSDRDPVRADNHLQVTTLKALDEVAGLPACGPLLDDFDVAMRTWLDEPDGTFHCVVVLPPCDTTDLIGTWARSCGHTVLCAPKRKQGHALSIVEGTFEEMRAEKCAKDAKGIAQTPEKEAALLVIPQLESWFLRRRNGLDAVRALLVELQQSERRCLIGCNSWAWAFLVRAVGAALVLPSPRTFVAFDAKRLKAWFAELAAQTGSDRVAFRLAISGIDVFETKDGGALTSNYLQELAARSNGIPWVAWHLWRNALRTGIDASKTQRPGENTDAHGPHTGGQSDAPARTQAHQVDGCPKNGVHGSERVFWVTGVPDPELPQHQNENALLVLHALLMHGALDQDELLGVLPDATAIEVLPALLRAGFIEQREGQLAVLPSAYPAVRRRLLADGFPVGDL